ncbi:MAG TPA: M56 family metallopeptidase [Lacipirellulaceae bacterium]|jgi:beta-lactamase regulating signal transducer with metallopeptidase domain|nr:M56 family metallopeptidase [Lacipirellulaceae bacterium]
MSWLSWIASNVVLASLVALAAWFVERRLRMNAVARILWLLALVKLVTPPLVSVQLGSLACALGTCNCGHAQTQSFVRDTLPWALLAAWSTGAGATLWLACCRWHRFQRLVAHARPAPPEWQSLAARLCAKLSIRRPPEILAAPGRLPPLVVPGWRRPRLLLPMALLNQLNPSQRAALILHELSHIKRGDHLVRILEVAVGLIFWWLPIFRLIGRQLRACEEACCDAAVVAHLPQARREYARLLLDVIDFANPLPQQSIPPVTAMSATGGLEQRLRAILGTTHKTGRAWPAAALAVGLACATLPCELHCELVAPPLPQVQVAGTATWANVQLDGCEPTAAAQTSLSPAEENAWLAIYCCPR